MAPLSEISSYATATLSYACIKLQLAILSSYIHVYVSLWLHIASYVAEKYLHGDFHF